MVRFWGGIAVVSYQRGAIRNSDKTEPTRVRHVKPEMCWARMREGGMTGSAGSRQGARRHLLDTVSL